MNTMENVLPLSCSCSNCDWSLCTMKSKINKNIAYCCCGQNPRSEQFVYICNTCSPKESAKPIKETETCCKSEYDKRPCNEKDVKKGEKIEPSKKCLRKEKVDNKSTGNKTQKNVKTDCDSKHCKTKIYNNNKHKTVESTGGKCKDIKEKISSIFNTKSKIKDKKNNLYSKIEEIYKICCCELCDCPLPLSEEKTSREDNYFMDAETKQLCLCSESRKDKTMCECQKQAGTPKPYSCQTIDKEVENAPPQISVPFCGKEIDENQSGFISTHSRKTKPLCLCSESRTDKTMCEYPKQAGTPKPCLCQTIDKEVENAPPQTSVPFCGKEMDENQSGFTSTHSRKTKPLCLCSESRTDKTMCEYPKQAGTPKPCSCQTIDKEVENAPPQTSMPFCRKEIDENQPGFTSTHSRKCCTISPKDSMVCSINQKRDKQSKEHKSVVPMTCPKLSCGQLNISCKPEKEVKIILPSKSPDVSSAQNNTKTQPELSMEEEHDDCPCHLEKIKNEGKNNGLPICDYAAHMDSSSSCADSDNSEKGYPTSASQTDNKEDENCPCKPDETPAASSGEIVANEETCQCNSCECINCPNAQKKDKAKNKGGVRTKMCKGTNCLVSTCRKDHKNCVCERKRTVPSRKRKSKTQINKFDVHRALICENLPFNNAANENSVSDSGNRKIRLCDCYLCKNNLHEYENILREVDRCGCSPCDCQFCNKNDTNDDTGLEKYKACRCAKCDCISCSNLRHDKSKLDKDNNNNYNKYSQDIKENKNKVKCDYNDILYENLTLLKKGEILHNFKTDKEKLVHDQIRFGINKDVSLPYVVISKEVQVITTGDNVKHSLAKNSIKKKSKENVKLSKNVKVRKATNKNSKACLNLLVPSNSGFIKKSLMIIEPERMGLKIGDEKETGRNIQIYIKLKNICDNADDYIKHLKDVLEKSKKDNEHFESIVEKIRNIQNTYNAENHDTTASRVLDLLKRQSLKN